MQIWSPTLKTGRLIHLIDIGVQVLLTGQSVNLYAPVYGQYLKYAVYATPPPSTISSDTLKHSNIGSSNMERTARLELASSAWKAEAQPIYHARITLTPAVDSAQVATCAKARGQMEPRVGFEPTHTCLQDRGAGRCATPANGGPYGNCTRALALTGPQSSTRNHGPYVEGGLLQGSRYYTFGLA